MRVGIADTGAAGRASPRPTTRHTRTKTQGTRIVVVRGHSRDIPGFHRWLWITHTNTEHVPCSSGDIPDTTPGFVLRFGYGTCGGRDGILQQTGPPHAYDTNATQGTHRIVARRHTGYIPGL